ncbi:unnamed protein product, partial [Brassica napus]
MMKELGLDLEEEVLLRVPLESILKFKTVSKQWRSLLESRSFSERRRIIIQKTQKKMQFVAAALLLNINPEVVVKDDDEEVEMIYLDCDFPKVQEEDSGFSRRPSLSCDGLVCMPVPGWINVLNPSTGEFLRFDSGRDPKMTDVLVDGSRRGFEVFPGYWRMGFGRDIVNGSYKVARMCFEPNCSYCEILDINIGVWRKLKRKPLFYVGERLKSAFVNGSIHWLEVDCYYHTQKILALDLHTEKFRSVKTPPLFCKSGQIANLEDRLVVAAKDIGEPGFKFCIWSMDPRDETWSIAYSFHLSSSTRSSFISRCSHWWHWCMPLAVSKRGNFYFYDQEKKLHKYCSDTGLVRGVTYGGGIRIVAPFVENLLPIRGSASSGRTFGFRNLDEFETSSCFRQIKSSVRKEWLGITTTVVAVVALHPCSLSQGAPAMESLLTVAELGLSLLLIVFWGFISVVVVEAWRRRHSNVYVFLLHFFYNCIVSWILICLYIITSPVETVTTLEDPTSLKQVPCPHISDPADKYLSLIVPAFNEEQRLPAALEETMDYLQGRASRDKNFSYEVVIVDDGSVDGTKRVAVDFVKKYTVDNIRFIPLGKNQGKGEAIRTGMMHSRGELLLMLDADGATKITDLEKLENQIHAVAREENSIRDPALKNVAFKIGDVQVSAFGSRAHLEEKALATRKWYRNFLMKGFHLVVLLAAGSGIRDTQCGFKMFTRAAARRLFTNVHLKRPNLSRIIFDSVQDPGVVLCNSMIRGYTRAGLHREALELFRYMSEEKSIVPDKYSFTFALKACTGALDLERGLGIHELVSEMGFESDVYIGTALVEMYCKGGDLVRAREVFEEMPERDVVTWNIMVSGLVQNGCFGEALRLFRDMCLSCVEIDHIGSKDVCRCLHGLVVKKGFASGFSSGLIDMYCKCADLDAAECVFEDVWSKDDSSWGAMMAAYAHNGCFTKVLELFDIMRCYDVRMNKVAVVSALRAAGYVGDLEKGIAIHEYVVQQGMVGDVSVATSLVSMYSKCGELEIAEQLFTNITDRDVVTWSAMIASFELAGHHDDALSLFRDMMKTDVKPNTVALTSVLPACTGIGIAASRLGKSIHCYAIRTDIESELAAATAIISMYAKSGLFSPALKAFERLPTKDAVAFNALAQGYTQIGDACKAFDLYNKMKLHGVRPDSGTMVGLLQTCALCSDYDRGSCVYGQTIKHGFDSECQVAHALIDMFTKCHALAAAKSLFDKCGFEKSTVSWNIMMNGYL